MSRERREGERREWSRLSRGREWKRWRCGHRLGCLEARGSRLSLRPLTQQRLGGRGKVVVARECVASRPPPGLNPAGGRLIGATLGWSGPRHATRRRRAWLQVRISNGAHGDAAIILFIVRGLGDKLHSPVTGEDGALLATLPTRSPPLILRRILSPGNRSRCNLSQLSWTGLPPTLPRRSPSACCLPSLPFPTARVLPLASIFSTFCNDDR